MWEWPVMLQSRRSVGAPAAGRVLPPRSDDFGGRGIVMEMGWWNLRCLGSMVTTGLTDTPLPRTFSTKSSLTGWAYTSWQSHYDNSKTRSPAVARTADHAGCQWPSKSSKVNDFHLIWQGICHFLLVINSNQGPILHHLATVYLWQMDDEQTDRRQSWQQLDHY